jgi:hypothetical protein
MRFIRFLPVLFFLSDSCIEPLEGENYDYEPKLVVDGLITDQPGPYSVNLYLSSATNGDLDRQSRVSDAIVTIFDDAGNSERLTETASGKYETAAKGIRGTIGRKYHVTITVDGKEYISEPQTMLPAGTITDLYGEFSEDAINKIDISLPSDIISVYLNSQGEEGLPNLYRWRWSAIYEVRTFPELRVRYTEFGPVPDPVPCSGLVSEGPGLEPTGICTCCHCWVDEFGHNALVSNNDFVSDINFNNVLLARIPVTGVRFMYRYYFKVEQMSVDENVYAFWKLIQAQQNSTADLFQPNSIRISGNIRSLSDPDEDVLGIFAVSAVVEKSFFIPRSLIKVPLAVDTITDDCRAIYVGSTNVKPPFW